MPLDDGTLAQSAQRVLLGELPHRDFAELYTGGLSFLNAGVLWVAGDNLFWLRVPMFLLFLVYLPCVYLIARRFASPAVATLAALFAVAWGPPVYPAAMPSWYTLYLAVIGAYFLVRHHESGGRAGCSRQASRAGSPSPARSPASGTCWRSPSTSCTGRRREREASEARQRSTGRSTRLVFAGVPAVSALFVAAVLAEKLGAAEAVNLLLPVVAVCVLAAWRGLRGDGSLASLCAPAALFLAGVMLPLVLLAAPYVATGSIGDLYTGLFVTPRGRLESGYYGTAGPVALAFAVPTLAVLYALGRRGRSARKTDLVASAAVAALLLVSIATLAGYLTMWYVTTALLPVGVLVGVVVLLREDDAGVRPGGRRSSSSSP